jgi:hypothetical protein
MSSNAVKSVLALAVGALMALPAVSALAQPRILVELFTSQGCSSCPAADKLLGELAKDPDVVVLSLSVDYWDYLGWKDTLALPGHAKRQHGYAGVRGDRAVYTPQVVVNGAAHVLGSDKDAIKKAVDDARNGNGGDAIRFDVSVKDGVIKVDLPAGKQDGEIAEIWLCPLSKSVPVKIGRGDNRGHTINYTNVVRGWRKVGEWNGEARQLSIPVASIKAPGDFDSVAILVQHGKQGAPGRVLGSATANLP